MKKAILLLLILILPLSHSLPQQHKGFVPDNITSLGSAGNGFKFENQYAFIVGINDYKYLNPLNNCVRDAQSVENILKSKYGFRETNITPLYNGEATYDAVTEKLREYIRVMTEKDSLFIYFSGHGFLDELLSETSWLPVNVGDDVAGIKTLKNQKAFKKICEKSSKKISGELVVKFLKNCRARHIFMVADSCFSSRFLADMKNTPRRLPAAEKFSLKSRQVLASGRGLVSDGERGTHSPFATFFMQYLKKKRKGYISAGALMAYVQDVVPNNSNPRQLPLGRTVIGTGDEGGDFYFVPVSVGKIQPETDSGNNSDTDSKTDPESGDQLSNIYRKVQRKRQKVEEKKKAWDRWQTHLKSRYDYAVEIDESTYADANDKFKAWELVLKEFDRDNPYSNEDDKLKHDVIQKLKHWSKEIKNPYKLITVSNFQELRKLDENPIIVCYRSKEEICKIINFRDISTGVFWVPDSTDTVELKNSGYTGKKYDISGGNLSVGDRPVIKRDEIENLRLTTIDIKNRQGYWGTVDIEDDLGNKYSYPVAVGDSKIQIIGSRIKNAEVYFYYSKMNRYRFSVLEGGKVLEIKCAWEINEYKIHFSPPGIEIESLPLFRVEGEVDENGKPKNRRFSTGYDSAVTVYIPYGKTPKFTIRHSPRFEDTDGRLDGKNVYFNLKSRKHALAVVMVFNSQEASAEKKKLMVMLKEVRKKREEFKMLLIGNVTEDVRVWEYEKDVLGGRAIMNLKPRRKTIGSLKDVFEMITVDVRKEFAGVNFKYDLESEVPVNKVTRDELIIITDRYSKPESYYFEFFGRQDHDTLDIRIVDYREVLIAGTISTFIK